MRRRQSADQYNQYDDVMQLYISYAPVTGHSLDHRVGISDQIFHCVTFAE